MRYFFLIHIKKSHETYWFRRGRRSFRFLSLVALICFCAKPVLAQTALKRALQQVSATGLFVNLAQNGIDTNGRLVDASVSNLVRGGKTMELELVVH